jgi:diketogulonate reductase-like aldo/keto reductase
MEFPHIGFGTYKLRTQEAIDNALTEAFKNNYKMIDTAEIYRNQKFIGTFLKNNPEIKRDSIWITSKVSFASMRKSEEETIKGISKTFDDLKSDYVDLYLIHAPVEEGYLFTWNYLRNLQKERKIRYIGVSNFTVEKLKKFMELIGPEESKHIFCNQIEYNPFLNRKDLIQLCKENNIHITAYGSLYKVDSTIENIARQLQRTPQQVLLKWAVQKNIRVIPMSEVPQFTKDNISLDFTIKDDDMEKMESLNENFSMYAKYL